MILVEKITIEEFRGIRKLTLNFKGKNFAVCGPNGTGKSGVVDALEFGLTGNISRLSGSGTGTVSLKKHAPHVDSRDYPEKAKVTLVFRIPSLKNQHISIERNVANPFAPIITPDKPEIRDILNQLENHPEFVLSRRELIAYVLAQPGKRSEEIQALLRLDSIGELRGTLKTIANSTKKDADSLKKVAVQARDQLAQALEIPEVTNEKLLKAANDRRVLLGLVPIDSLTSTTSLHDGLKSGTKSGEIQKINKMEVLSDIAGYKEIILKLTSPETKKVTEKLTTDIAALSEDKNIIDNVSKEKFLRDSIAFVTEDACPICDTQLNQEKLFLVINKKLKKFEETTVLINDLEVRLEPIVGSLLSLEDNLKSLEKHSNILTKDKTSILTSFRSSVSLKIKNLRSFIPLRDTMDSLTNTSLIPKDIESVITEVEESVLKIPEPNQQDAARDYLILCQDRLERYRETMRNAKLAEEHASIAETTHDVYAEESNKVLESVYAEVEEEFSKFYRYVNQDDEDNFSAKLTPSIGKLGFDVDFYGRGHFPPGAYHSEGHQDGMGLCLYLALMQRLQGNNFKFAVLDDVLMSVDTGHRREVCKLLKELFPDTQFILTTHDDVWLKHMGSVGLISPGSSVAFSDWTPDHGPTEWEGRDVWSEIQGHLKGNDVRSAASILRYYLEHIFKDICHNLHAQVQFRGDNRYELGDLLPSAVRRLRDLLNDGKKSADSWGDVVNSKIFLDREKNLADSFRRSNADQWQINSSIHYNEWANLSSTDFAPVAAAFKDLIEHFFCLESGCEGLCYLTFASNRTPDTLRCTCGKTTINLKCK